MVAGALYHTDLGIVLALLSNMPNKPHGVPKDATGRTAKLGHVFYKKTIGTKSRIDLYLLEDGRSAIEDISLTMTREIPVIRSEIFENYELTEKGLERKFQETLSKPDEEKSAEIMICFVNSPKYQETQIPDVHNVLWSAAGQLEVEPTNHVTPVEISEQVWTQVRRAVIYDVLRYYDHKIAQKAERAAEKRLKEIERKSTFDFGK
ncbi:MAG: hypothetical protein KAT43_05415 [Nanoarchaeota archaeon]|nr:hypothetical protein [Nanoarchaeota archaeon]